MLPERPRLTVRAGITGHRAGGLASADLPSLRDRIRQVLAAIAGAADDILRQQWTDYAPAAPAMVLVSSLASGGDSIVAREALASGYSIHVPLPFPREEFRADFATSQALAEHDTLLASATAVLELDGSRADEDGAYRRASAVMLEQADVLIAVWDGAESPYIGGTAHTIGRALALEIPVIWVDAAAPHGIRLVLHDGSRTTPADPRVAIAAVVAQQFPPVVDAADPVRTVYYSEPARPARGLGIFGRFRALVEMGAHHDAHHDAHHGAHHDAHNAAAAAPVRNAPDMLAAVSAALRAEHERADMLAQHYAARYRDAFVGNYLLGATAVLAALVGFVSPVGTVTELVLIGTIIIVTQRGRRGQWHERWLGYRLCAEQLRHLALLRPLGRALPSFRVPAHATESDPSRVWASWLAQARTRETGLASGQLTSASLAEYRAALHDVLRQQVQYHHRASERSHRLAHRLHALGISLFYVTLVVCVAHLGLEAWHHAHPAPLAPAGAGSNAMSMNGALTLLAAVLPAFGSALAGIASQAEFDRVAQRSRAMGQQLDALLQRLAATSRDSDAYAAVAVQGVEIMTAELLDWQSTFRAKPIVLPA